MKPNHNKRSSQQLDVRQDANSSAKSIIAVDLTPILLGGINGGAKIFILELLKSLAHSAPNIQFILLTHEVSHEELAFLDCNNMTRRIAIHNSATNKRRLNLRSAYTLLLPYIPSQLKRIITRTGNYVNRQLKRKAANSLLQEIHADLLFCPFTATTYFEPGIPTVSTVYDLQYKTNTKFFNPAEIAHRDYVFMQACKDADVLIAISEYSRQSAIFHGGINPEKIKTIYLRMANRMTAAPASQLVLKRFNLHRQRYLLYPANFWQHKNHEMLFIAFGMACKAGLPTDYKLICTGAAVERYEWLNKLVQAMHLSERIILSGYLSDDELSSLLLRCSGVIFPSLYEGFGLPIIEAMAAGVPVACSNVTALPEIANLNPIVQPRSNSSPSAILFDPRIPTQIMEAILALTGDRALRKNLVRAGKKRAAEFADGDRMTQEYLDVFYNLLGT